MGGNRPEGTPHLLDNVIARLLDNAGVGKIERVPSPPREGLELRVRDLIGHREIEERVCNPGGAARIACQGIAQHLQD